MSLNLGTIIAQSALQYPDFPALIFDSKRYTYCELDTAVRRFAAELLELGLERGDRIALMVPNIPEFTIAYFGILYAGGVAVPLSTLHVADEIVFQLDDCGAKALILHSQCADAGLEAHRRAKNKTAIYVVDFPTGQERPTGCRDLRDVLQETSHADMAQTCPSETAVILYTSGTTGNPKGVELTHFSLYANAQYISERTFSLWPDEIHILGPGDVGLAALPLYHTFGQTNIQNGMLVNGGAVTYLQRFTPQSAVEIIARDRVTFFAGVPSMYVGILHDAACQSADFSSLKYCASGGAPMPVDLKNRFHQKFGVRIQEGYGLTETSPLACIQKPNETHKAGTIGKPIAGVEMRCVDDQDQDVPRGERGEVIIRGHNIMKGYFNRPEATAAAMRNGWFHSGDIGLIDADGDFCIVDRKKEMIIRGGYNVYPREVEEVLYAHPAVREAAVIGIPHEVHGEEVKAVVAFKPGASATEEEIIAHCQKHVAKYKYPRIVEIRPELPKGPTGKILKRALKNPG
jgi:long-chain acyl-CoA synthetase